MEKIQKFGSSLLEGVIFFPVVALFIGMSKWIAIYSDGVISTALEYTGLAILEHLGVIFSASMAYALTKDKHGISSLSAMIGFFITTGIYNQMNHNIEFQLDNSNVFIGFIIAIIVAISYNKCSDKKLISCFAFFSGRRIIPIITSFLSVLLSFCLLMIWPIIATILFYMVEGIAALGNIGAGLFGFLNRLLIPTGLHHVLNAAFWTPLIGINDIGNFWMSAESSYEGIKIGMYQAGFFPIFMFALPGAALAIYQSAKEEDKKRIGKVLLWGAISSFFTGVTEPIEFIFMLTSPILYFIHSALTGLSLYIAAKLNLIAGFGFSAGCIDFILSSNMPLASNIHLLIIEGISFFFIYYFLFKIAIKKFTVSIYSNI